MLARLACTATLTLGILATPASAQRIRMTLDTARSGVWFDAHATLGSFTGRARNFRGRVELADTVNPAEARGEVEVDVASIGTGIGARDGHLRDEMQADRFPVVRFTLAGTEPAGTDLTAPFAGAGELPRRSLLLRGELTVRDQTREISIPALVRFTADSAYVRGRVPVRFTDFGMKPPSRFLGLAKVDDELLLAFEVVFGAAR
jgi:polyisoprenoid-binding protein YceI